MRLVDDADVFVHSMRPQRRSGSASATPPSRRATRASSTLTRRAIGRTGPTATVPLTTT